MLENFIRGWVDSLKVIAEHGTDNIFAFCLLTVFTYGLYRGYDEWFLLGITVIFGLGWHVRRCSAERHVEQMARTDIERIERTQLAPIRAKQRSKSKDKADKGDPD